MSLASPQERVRQAPSGGFRLLVDEDGERLRCIQCGVRRSGVSKKAPSDSMVQG